MARVLLINCLQVHIGKTSDELVRQKTVHTNPPLGLLYIASAVQEENPENSVVFFDHNLEWLRRVTKVGIEATLADDPVDQLLSGEKFDIVGIASIFSLFKRNHHTLLEKIKMYQPNALIVSGGGYPTFEPECSLRGLENGIAVIGEGEQRIKEILGLFHAHQGDIAKIMENLTPIPSIAYKKNGDFFINKKQHFIQNIDTIAFPNHDLIHYPDYVSFGRLNIRNTYMDRTTAVITTSRGCPCKCIYCAVPSIWGRSIRFRSPESVVAEMRYLYDNYNVRHYIFNDSNLTFNCDRAKKVCRKIIESKMDVKWCCPDGMAIWTFDQELVDLMVESGCYTFSIGIETGNDYMLKKVMKKPLSVRILREKVELLMKYRDQIYVTGLLMFGIPYEKKSDMRDTVNLALDLELDWYEFSITIPVPNTPMWDICVKEGFIDVTQDVSDAVYMDSYIQTPDFTIQEARDIAYEGNVRVNFLQNVNFLKYNFNRAIEDFSSVASRYPGHLYANYMLYHSYKKLGDSEKMLKYKTVLEKTLARDPKKMGEWEKYALSF